MTKSKSKSKSTKSKSKSLFAVRLAQAKASVKKAQKKRKIVSRPVYLIVSQTMDEVAEELAEFDDNGMTLDIEYASRNLARSRRELKDRAPRTNGRLGLLKVETLDELDGTLFGDAWKKGAANIVDGGTVKAATVTAPVPDDDIETAGSVMSREFNEKLTQVDGKRCPGAACRDALARGADPCGLPDCVTDLDDEDDGIDDEEESLEGSTVVTGEAPYKEGCVICENEGGHEAERQHVMKGQE